MNGKSRKRLVLASIAVATLAALGTYACAKKGDRAGAASQGETTEVWQCPMHPQIVSDKPGKCPICHMDLVKTMLKRGAPVATPRTTMETAPQPETETKTAGRKVLYWYDPMRPDAHFDKPGKSPFMNMQLVPKYADETGAQAPSGVPAVELAPGAVQAAGVKTAPVALRDVSHIIRAVGTLEADERKLAHIASRVAGRLDRLYLSFTGQPVKKGDPIFQIYSPDLVSSEREYLLALENRARARTGGDASYVRSADELLSAARDRLRLWGLDDPQLERIAREGRPELEIVTRSPVTGTVLKKNVIEGQYVKEGDELYLLADLSDIWLYVSVYEYELGAVRAGQSVTASVASFPGRAFEGRITFVDPVVDPASRTARLRVELPNADRSLRPGMFANAELKVAAGTKLAVPKSAVLDTGVRQLVYVKMGETTFQPREVKVGAVAGDVVEVVSGLHEGEEVVTAGGFLIDSQAQLATGASVQWSGASEVKTEAKAEANTQKAPQPTPGAPK